MLLLAVKSRLVAVAMMELGMDTISDKPSKNLFQKGTFFSESTSCTKNVYIKRLAAAIVDKYIMNRQAGEEIVKQALNEREQVMVKNRLVLPDGRFPCRSTGCNKTFK